MLQLPSLIGSNCGIVSHVLRDFSPVLKYDGSAGAFVSATSPSLLARPMTGAEPEVGRESRAGEMSSQRAWN